MDINNLYIYEVYGQSRGIVYAKNKKDAELKVREAYRKHDTGWWDQNRTVNIWSVHENNSWFLDCPDVIEISEVNK